MGNPFSPTNTSTLNSDSTLRDSSEKRPDKPRYYPKQIAFEHAWFHTDTLRFTDSQLLLNHRYTPFQNSIQPIMDLGAPGTPQQGLCHQKYQGGFTLALPLAPAFNISPLNFQFHEVGQPYTHFQYSQGAGSYTGLEALHTQNFAPTWNVSIHYRSVLNQDLYTGSTQDNLLRNLALGSQFVSQNKRYEQQVIFSWNRNRRLENGGYTNDTLFYGTDENISETPIIRSFGIYVPRLISASSFLSNTHHRFLQRYFLSPKVKHHLWQNLEYQNDRFTYSDDSRDSSYYGNNYQFSKNNFNDSTGLRYGTHSLGWGLRDTLGNQTFSLELAHRYQYAHWRTLINDTLRQSVWNTSHGYEINAQWTRFHQSIMLDFQQLLSGYLSNNHTLNLRAEHRINDSANVEISVYQSQQSPNLFQTQFLNNHFDFRGKFSADHRITQTQISGRYTQRSTNFQILMEFKLGKMNGEIRSLFTPTPVIIEPYSYAQASMDLRYNLPKHWMFVGSMHFQGNNAKELKNLGLPTFFSRFGVSYQNEAFSKALIYRLGFDASYTSDYNGFYYRADNRQFYANTSGINLGNYPVLDVYFSGRIQTVDFFLKYEHLNHWWVLPFANTRYENVLNYPIQPDRFRFGFIWHFWN